MPFKSKERQRAWCAAWRAKHPGYMTAYCREHRRQFPLAKKRPAVEPTLIPAKAKRREFLRQYCREWRKKNPTYMRDYQRRYRAAYDTKKKNRQ